ncbi:MAG: ATP-dependent zinc protease family protein [Planctomycetota bacterium]|jgi:hypothetical protein
MSPPSGSSPDRITIGWREWIALPDLGIPQIKAKIDTGARSSSLHAFGVERFRRGEREFVRFHVHPIQRDASQTITAEAELLEMRKVKSSGGHVSQRPVILTTIEILGERRHVEVTLAARTTMGFRMLLGRQALRGKYVVDPGRSYRGGRPKRKRKKPKST